MSTPRLPDYLQHIRLAAHQAETYIEGVELDEFLQNDFVQNAVRSTLITIGEAATRIINKYPDFVAEHPEVPWHVMRGMRNQIAHTAENSGRVEEHHCQSLALFPERPRKRTEKNDL